MFLCFMELETLALVLQNSLLESELSTSFHTVSPLAPILILLSSNFPNLICAKHTHTHTHTYIYIYMYIYYPQT